MGQNSSNNTSSNGQDSWQYWQGQVPPRPQDSSTAKARYWHGPGPDPTQHEQAQAWEPQSCQTPYTNNQNIPNPPGQQPYVASKDHVAAGLLGIFLGVFGVHKFYLGYTSAGFIMLGVSTLGSLFTLGLAGAVMALIGFIEGIIYLTKNQTQFTQEYVYNRKEWF